MSRKRTLCVIIPGFSDGGAQRQCIYLLNELQKRPELDLHVIRFSVGVHDGLLRRERIAIHDLPLQSNYDFRVLVGLLAVVRRIRPHIVLSWLHAADVYSFFLRRLLTKTRWIMTERDSSYPREFRYLLRQAVGKYADAIIANSEAGRAYWLQRGAKGPCHVVGNIMRPVPNRLVPPVVPRRVICVGRLEPQKNVVGLAKAAAVLVKRRPDVEFLFVGEGSQRDEIEDVIKRGAVDRQVRLVGFQRDVDSYLISAAALVSFSLHEGLPNALMEAASAGVPIIATAIPEHKALLGNDYPYLVQDAGDSDAAAAMIERALEPGATQHLAEAQRHLSKMTPAAVAEAYLTIFEQVLSKP